MPGQPGEPGPPGHPTHPGVSCAENTLTCCKNTSLYLVQIHVLANKCNKQMQIMSEDVKNYCSHTLKMKHQCCSALTCDMSARTNYTLHYKFSTFESLNLTARNYTGETFIINQ